MALAGPLTFGRSRSFRVRAHSEPRELGNDFSAASRGLVEAFQHENTRALAQHEPLAPERKGPAAVRGQHPQGFPCLERPEGEARFAATGKRPVYHPGTNHLEGEANGVRGG